MTTAPPPGRGRDLAALVAFLAICFAVAGLGGAVTATSVDDWYPTLAKPGFNPPAWVFPPIWTALFAAMAVAGWRVWRRAGLAGARAAFAAFAAQLALNLGWSALFFGLRSPGAALVEIVPLLAAIVVTGTLFWRIDQLAGLLFVPYALWVGFATLLTAAIWWLN